MQIRGRDEVRERVCQIYRKNKKKGGMDLNRICRVWRKAEDVHMRDWNPLLCAGIVCHRKKVKGFREEAGGEMLSSNTPVIPLGAKGKTAWRLSIK